MRKFLPFLTLLFFMSILYGCDKEKIVTTTETVRETEYIELPPDTVLIADPLFLTDSVIVNNSDTVTLFVNITDTLTTFDTLFITNTLTDTVTITQNFYDTVTVTVTDTVIQNNVTPDEYYAYSALQSHTDPAVLQFINTEFGLTDGWIFYLSSFQHNITNPSAGVYDFYGYIDYWTPDWSSYYPLEYAWRVTFTGGDASNPQNWTLTDPPVVVSGKNSGITLSKDRVISVSK